jgi:hypothetical protein
MDQLQQILFILAYPLLVLSALAGPISYVALLWTVWRIWRKVRHLPG